MKLKPHHILIFAILIGLLSSMACMAQGKPIKRYWQYTATFVLTNGCENSTVGTFESNSEWISYDKIKTQTAMRVSPYKIKSIKVTGLSEIKKSQLIKKSDKYVCPQPIKLAFSFDTTKIASTLPSTYSIKGFSDIQPSSLVWHWGDNKIPMTWLPKPRMDKIDSVEIYINKRLTYWLNDSTLIIKKP